MKAETALLNATCPDALTGALSTPIYQTSTYVQEAPGINKGFDYTRTNNPTRKVLEKLITDLEGGHAGFAFASGMSAIDAVLKLLNTGDEIIAVDDIYGGAYRLLNTIYNRFGINIKFIDTSNSENLAKAITSKTRMLWLESPTNPTLKISDIKTLGEIAHQHKIQVVVDNTFASPILQQPLNLGADIVIHSATKYLAGHSDVLAGLVVAKDKETAEKINYIQNASGAVLAPFDCWLTLRGIQTIYLRMERQSENAMKIAQRLLQSPYVDKLYYPGLSTHKNHEIAARQQKGFGGMLSFSLKDDRSELAIAFISSTQLFKLAESLGGTKSLICHPASMTHKSTPESVRKAAGIQDSLIRVSCGIEHVEDLIEDLENTFHSVSKVWGKSV